VKPTYGLSIETTGPDCRESSVVAVAVFNPSDVISIAGSDERHLLDQLYQFMRCVPAGVLATGNGGQFETPFLVYRSQRVGMDRSCYRQVGDPGESRPSRHHGSTSLVYQLTMESSSPLTYVSPTTRSDRADHTPFDLSYSGARLSGPVPTAVGDVPFSPGAHLTTTGERVRRNLDRAERIYDAATFSAAAA
jgi:hypothetical protein